MKPTLILSLALALFGSPACAGETTTFREQRLEMVRDDVQARGIEDPRVLDALRTVRRHEFVPEEYRDLAYGDAPLPIGYGQTISQPYIVAYMTEQLDLGPEHRLFELGTGSGYQAAVASLLVDEVYTVEIVAPLAERAREVLERLGHDNVHVRAGDGWAGWPEAAPFDRIIVTAAAPELPDDLIGQLRPGGRLIMPLGGEDEVQRLVLVDKSDSGRISVRELLAVRFVPVTGQD